MIHQISTEKPQEPPEPTIPQDHWVVLLWDPDHSDTSPWSVVAPTMEAAIQRAGAAWVEDFEADDEPQVHKVYRGSWIAERVL